MKQRLIFTCLAAITFLSISMVGAAAASDALTPTTLRCEYLENPLGIDQTTPRLSWRVESNQRAQMQAAYRILVASSPQKLAAEEADLWDSGKVLSSRTLFVEYAGKPLTSRMQCFWKVQVWDMEGASPTCSKSASWTMGLLDESDWAANYISYRDESEVFKDRESLYLPAARQYRKEFSAEKEVRRATIYATALGIYELHLNGERVGDAYFAPGWTDYRQRAYYNTYDVTNRIQTGDNAIGSWVAEGWYSGYVGFGLLTGIGTERIGRYTYGKTPAFMAQLEIEYSDGTTEMVSTDQSWKVSGEGPIQEADLLMGEAYDARREFPLWATTAFDDSDWQDAILAADNGNPTATFYQYQNPPAGKGGPKIVGEERDLGFQRPKLEAFPGVPVRIIEELPALTVDKRAAGTFILNLGQNFAGVIRMKVKGPAGHTIKLRFGEMLYPDGRLMTENLRKARAIDFYTCKGDPDGEVYQPRFTFHGFQYVELSNFPGEVDLETITGLAMHSDTPLTSTFECSDPMVNQLFSNVVWTQRANFLDLPTDCPQRDERMGWTGDAQAYVATAAYNADIGAFYTKWLRELMESQRPSGVFPGYAPFPFQHGQDFGTAWADAGVICPWTIWQVYGDTRVIEECWEPMTTFLEWRKRTSKNDLGVVHGNNWGDWLAQGASTPLDFIDTVYYAISAKMMSEMAEAIGKPSEAKAYQQQFERTRAAFQQKYLRDDGSVTVKTQTAHTLALFADLVPDEMRSATAEKLAQMISRNGNHMSTGFLGTRPLLPVLSSAGQHDLATFLLQSREFPSWGYEIDNGATTIWERWDSYTKEDAFGRHNAAMNSFSHYAFGAVNEWMFRTLAGIGSDGPGYQKIIIAPEPPSPGSNAQHEPIHWVKASYDSIRGMIRSEWHVREGTFTLNTSVPANTTATVYLPASDISKVTESGKPIDQVVGVKLIRMDDNQAVLSVQSGDYRFVSRDAVAATSNALETSEPMDMSMNPDEIDISTAQPIANWDFSKASDVQAWSERNNLNMTTEGDLTVVTSTGSDPQMITTLPQAASGDLVLEVQAITGKGTSVFLFWSSPGGGFNGAQSTSRSLSASDQLRSYLFSIGDDTPLKKLRFDPFAESGKMEIQSITLYRMAD